MGIENAEMSTANIKIGTEKSRSTEYEILVENSTEKVEMGTQKSLKAFVILYI